uniref:Uncharacterized protein n=1 Tax=Arundo donax TaxID=35708 RepID=A0A0A9F4R8_ARUDO
MLRQHKSSVDIIEQQNMELSVLIVLKPISLDKEEFFLDIRKFNGKSANSLYNLHETSIFFKI